LRRVFAAWDFERILYKMLPRDSADLKGKSRRITYGDKERHPTRRTSSFLAAPPSRSSSILSTPIPTPRSSFFGGITSGHHDPVGGEEDRPLGVGERLLERLFQRVPSPPARKNDVPEENNYNDSNHQNNDNNRNNRNIRNHNKTSNRPNNSISHDNDSRSNITEQPLQAATTSAGQRIQVVSEQELEEVAYRGGEDGENSSNHEERTKNSRPLSSKLFENNSSDNLLLNVDRPADRQKEDYGLISCATGGFYMSENQYKSENRNKREGGYKVGGSDKDINQNNDKVIHDDEEDDGDEEEEEETGLVGRKRSKSVRFSAADEYCNTDNGEHHQKVVERLLFYMDNILQQQGGIVIVMYLYHCHHHILTHIQYDGSYLHFYLM